VSISKCSEIALIAVAVFGTLEQASSDNILRDCLPIGLRSTTSDDARDCRFASSRSAGYQGVNKVSPYSILYRPVAENGTGCCAFSTVAHSVECRNGIRKQPNNHPSNGASVKLSIHHIQVGSAVG
jgi:hypothetical protein